MKSWLFCLLFFVCSPLIAELDLSPDNSTNSTRNSNIVLSSSDSKPITASSTAALKRDVDVVPKIIDVTFGLLGILLLIGGIAWFVRRFGRTQIASKGHLKIVGGLHIGTRERLVLVQVGDKQLLLGVTSGRIEKLYELNEPIPYETELSGPDNSFYEKFTSILKAK
ncbi:MAG: flagellar biosynthetic protein FliO [Thiohalomonadales bacterium]